jgi:hypothetical protein
MTEPVRFFFIHVMKTGGTSFVRQMLTNFEPDEVYPSEVDRSDSSDTERYTDLPKMIDLSDERRARVRVYAGHHPYVASELLGIDLVRLTLLRHPVDRTVSMLKHLKRRFENFSDLSLDAIYDDDTAFRTSLGNAQTNAFSLTARERELVREFMDSKVDDETLTRSVPIEPDRFAQAKAHLANVDVIGLSEQYGDFIDELRTRFGWWPNGVNAHVRTNVSSEDWPVSSALRQRIADELVTDIEFYEYARELVETRRRSS